MHLTKQQIRLLARQILGFEHSLVSANIEQTDGIRVDDLIDKAIRAWYLDLLDNGDIAMLVPQTPEHLSVTLSRTCDGAQLTLPDSVRRVLFVHHEGWKRAANVLPASELQRIVSRQRNPFTAATPYTPVAVEDPDCRHIVTFPTPENANGAVTAVIDPGDDDFIFDESAIASLAAFLHSQKFKNFFP